MRAGRSASAWRGWRERRSWSTARRCAPTPSSSPPARGCRSCWDRSPASRYRSPQQEIIYFATPPGDARFDAGTCRRGSSTRRLLRPAVDRGPRLQGRAGLAGPDGRPRHAGAPPLRRAGRRVARVPAAPVPGPRGSAGGGGSRLPVRADAGHALRHRPPPDARWRVDRRGRLGARLQARPGRRRVRQRARRQRRCRGTSRRRTTDSRSGRAIGAGVGLRTSGEAPGPLAGIRRQRIGEVAVRLVAEEDEAHELDPGRPAQVIGHVATATRAPSSAG